MFDTKNIGISLARLLQSSYRDELSNRNNNRRSYRKSLRENSSVKQLINYWSLYAEFLKVTSLQANPEIVWGIIRDAELRNNNNLQYNLVVELLTHFIPSATIMRGKIGNFIMQDCEGEDEPTSIVVNLPIAIYDVLVIMLGIHWTSSNEGRACIFRREIVESIREGNGVDIDAEINAGIKWALDMQSTIAMVNPDILKLFYNNYDDPEIGRDFKNFAQHVFVQMGMKWKQLESTQGYAAVTNFYETLSISILANGIRAILKITQELLETIGAPISIYLADKLNFINETDMYQHMNGSNSEHPQEATDIYIKQFKIANDKYFVSLPNDDELYYRLGTSVPLWIDEVAKDTSAKESPITESVEEDDSAAQRTQEETHNLPEGQRLIGNIIIRRYNDVWQERKTMDLGGRVIEYWVEISEDEIAELERQHANANNEDAVQSANSREEWTNIIERAAEEARANLEAVDSNAHVSVNREPNTFYPDDDSVVSPAAINYRAVRDAFDAVIDNITAHTEQAQVPAQEPIHYQELPEEAEDLDNENVLYEINDIDDIATGFARTTTQEGIRIRFVDDDAAVTADAGNATTENVDYIGGIGIANNDQDGLTPVLTETPHGLRITWR